MDFPGFSFDLAALGSENKPDLNVIYDLIVLGGGPAAMSASIYAARKMLRLALLTKDFGGQVASTSEIENYLGFQSISGRELTDKFVEQVKQFDVPIGEGEKVVEVVEKKGAFDIQLESGAVFSCNSLIVATGKRDRPLGVPGEKELVGKGVAYCATCDAPFFKDKRVIVAGGGNSAFTAAIDLLKVGASVTMVNYAVGWQADEVMKSAIAKHEHVEFLDNHQVTQIEGTERVSAVRLKERSSGEAKSLAADGVFVEIGLLPNSDSVRDLAELNKAGELIVDCHCRTSVPGLFGAGDVTTVPKKQIIISAGEGAKAALAAYDYLSEKQLI
ncbi:MAG: FAD-dependent oxidoreductase [Myxococcota bacterium]|nr:FAD-dependent oxidoreductase [Myxococcota bacterium]